MNSMFPARQRLATMLLTALVVLALLAGTSRPAAVAEGPDAGVLVTLSATAEELESAAGEPAAGLVIRVTLENQSGTDLSDLRLHAPIPPHTRVAASWLGSPDHQAGAVDGAGVAWSGLALRNGERLGPFAYRIVPADGADGGLIFLHAAVQPTVTWNRPQLGTASSMSLPLRGLWGDTGLRRTLLPSGLTVLTFERPETDTVVVRAAVRAGSRDEDDLTHGGSHWLEHGHLLGTPTRPTAQLIARDIERVGGRQSAATSAEWTDYAHWVPAEQFGVALDVLADMLLNSTFPREAFDRERRVVFEEIRRAQDNPAARAQNEFLKLVFTVSPLRRDVLGPIERVQSIPIDTILAYREQRYVTGNMAVAAVGKIDHDTAVARIAAAFQDLRRGPRSVRPPTPEPVQTELRRLIVGEGTRLSEIRLGWPVPGVDDPDSSALLVLEEILGQTHRRLVREVRDRRGLAPSVGISYVQFSDAGALVLGATAPLTNEQGVIDALLAEVQRLRDGDVTDEEVQTSITAIAGRSALVEESNNALAARVLAEVTGDAESTAELLALLRTVTAADLQRVARVYLNPAAYTLVVVRS